MTISRRVVWRELATADPDAASRFYAALFGWKVKKGPLGDLGAYYVFSRDGVELGAAMQGGPAAAARWSESPGVEPHWLVYFGADDVDDDAANLVSSGGAILFPPMTFGALFRFAIVRDARGATFGLMKWLDDVKRGGGFAHDRLHAADPALFGDARPHYLSFVRVSDVEATVAAACSLGGAVVVDTEHRAEIGVASILKDPTGARFGLVEAR
jgi:hypothetical protein